MSEPQIKRPRARPLSEAEALAELRRHATVGLRVARAVLRVGAEAMARGVASGAVPVIQCGRERRVPSARLLALLGLQVEPKPLEAAAEVAVQPDEGT